MIVKNFNITELELTYFIGINRIKINANVYTIDQLFELSDKIQNKYSDSILQFFNENYILNTEHIFNACYFSLKAFHYKKNISNKKEIEFLLYLATKRQIKSAINDVGINNSNIQNGIVNYCIVSYVDNVSVINNAIKEALNANEIKFTLTQENADKFKIIKEHFEISDEQIKIILNSYGIKKDIEVLLKENIHSLYSVLNELICEKMALLSLEKIAID